MTATATAIATFSVVIGKTDAEFEIHCDRDWSEDGLPFVSEWLALPYDAEVKEIRRSEGTGESYAHVIALANLVVRMAPAGSIVVVNVSDGTGQSFSCGIWETREDALANLARLGS